MRVCLGRGNFVILNSATTVVAGSFMKVCKSIFGKTSHCSFSKI